MRQPFRHCSVVFSQQFCVAVLMLTAVSNSAWSQQQYNPAVDYSQYQSMPPQNWYPQGDFQSGQVHIPAPVSTPTIRDLAVGNMIGGGLGQIGNGTITGTGTSTSTFLDPIALTNFDSTFSETYNGSFTIPFTRAPKIADNNSPIPQNRVYFTYNHSHNSFSSIQNVTQAAGNINNPDVPSNVTDFIENAAFLAANPGFQSTPTNVTRAVGGHQDRYTLGIEKEIAFGDMSFELRIPMVGLNETAVGGNSQIPGNSFASGTDDPLGKVSLNFKQILFDSVTSDHSMLLSWGAGLVFPSGEGASINLYNTSFHVEDSTLHFTPFLAFLATKHDKLFVQGFLSLDIANSALDITASGLGKVGSFHVPNLANIDVGLGYWLFRNTQRRLIRGVAPMLEYHYSAHLQDPQGAAFNLANGTNPTSTGSVVLNADTNRYNFQTITTGLHVELTEWANMRAAGVFPLLNGQSREFDGQFALQLDFTR